MESGRPGSASVGLLHSFRLRRYAPHGCPQRRGAEEVPPEFRTAEEVPPSFRSALDGVPSACPAGRFRRLCGATCADFSRRESESEDVGVVEQTQLLAQLRLAVDPRRRKPMSRDTGATGFAGSQSASAAASCAGEMIRFAGSRSIASLSAACRRSGNPSIETGCS